MHISRLFVLVIATAALVASTTACGGDAAGETRTDDLASETPRTEADFGGVDCRASCPAAGISGGLVGPISGERVASLDFEQAGTCSADLSLRPEGFHVKRAGEPCLLGSAPAHGQPISGAYVCEAFQCGETGTFRASACIAPSIGSAADSRTPPGTCATKAEACAAAREVAARSEAQLCL
jgi:hypothetical protein